MNSLQPLRIEEPGGIAENHPAIARDRRDRPPAAIGKRLPPIADHLAAIEQPGDHGMLFEILQHTLRIEPRIRVVERGDETERDDIVFAAVNPGAAVFLGGQRPAHGVNDLTGRDSTRRDLPQLFYALTINL